MLAKLLATENIKVEHGNYETAAFDPKKNLTIPSILILYKYRNEKP